MFEVGKQYICPQMKDPYLCKYVGKSFVILYRESCNHEVLAYLNESWQEYVPPKPLIFADLKVGEKFKWINPRGHSGSEYIKTMTEHKPYYYTTLNGPLAGHSYSNSNDDIPANYVERVD